MINADHDTYLCVGGPIDGSRMIALPIDLMNKVGRQTTLLEDGHRYVFDTDFQVWVYSPRKKESEDDNA